ncbi:hypothetical protein ACFQFG_20000 [Methylobacterium persicinum]
MRSLRARLVAAALGLVAIALVIAGLAVGVILTRFVRGQVDERLDAQITALRAGLEAGILAAHPERFEGPPFDRPGRWVWEVRRGDDIVRSDSSTGTRSPSAGQDRRNRATAPSRPRDAAPAAATSSCACSPCGARSPRRSSPAPPRGRSTAPSGM